MDKFDKYLNPRSILAWYLLSLLFSILGTYLAYNEPIGSEAWRIWSPAGEDAWIKDAIRAIAITFVSLFFLWNLDVLADWRTAPQNCYPIFRLSAFETMTVVALTILLLILQFTYLRDDFVRNLPLRNYPSLQASPEMYSFKKITLPYIPYSLYAIGVYIGIMLPIILFSLRRFKVDLSIFVQSKKHLENLAHQQQASAEHLTVPQFRQFELAFQNYVILLKNFCERYVPLILGIAIFLIIEQVSGSIDTSTQSAIEITKIFIWIFLGPVLFSFMILIAFGYQTTVKSAEQKLLALIDCIDASPGTGELIGEIINFREKLIWNYSPLSFMVSTVKSASIAIPLLLTLTFYIMQAIIKESNWLYIVFPKEIVQFFKDLY